MAPRKKRNVTKTVRKTKVTTKTKKYMTKTSASTSITEPNPEEPKISSVPDSVSKAKKFGKFRCLLEGNNESTNDNQPIENVTNSENNITNETESENVEKIDTKASSPYNPEEPMETDVTETENAQPIDESENLTAEISTQLSNLNVNIVDNKTGDSPEIKDSANLEKSDNRNASNEIFAIENIQNEFSVECVSEEIVTEIVEQEIVIDNAKTNATECPEDISLINATITSSSETKSSNVEDNIEGNLPIEEKQVEEIENKTDVKIKPKPIKTKTVKKKQTPTVKIKRNNTQKVKKTKKNNLEKINSDTSEGSTASENSVRRSNRIKSISVLKQRSKGQGLVKNKSEPKIQMPEKANVPDSDTSENSNSGQTDSEKTSIDSPNFLTPSSGYESDHRPVKVKSRWRRSSELEMSSFAQPNLQVKNASEELVQTQAADTSLPNSDKTSLCSDEEIKDRFKQFVHLKENHYSTIRVVCKEAKKMVCDCFLTQEETERGEYGCGEDCLNRLLMIECGPLCPVNDRCTNKRFQKAQFSSCEVFKTEKKGLGIRATTNIPCGEFVLEYVGEVIGPDEFEERAKEYSKDKNPHYYFMSLRSDAVIDATQKGNISRFINHSCEPNAETQKWTVNGELRIGFFSKRTILAGEEITFDYQFQRYGKEAQKCFCETSTCRGWLGEEPDDDDDDEDEEDEEISESGIKSEQCTEQVSPLAPDSMHDKSEEETLISTEVASITGTDVDTSVSKTKTETKKTNKKGKRKLINRKVLKDIFDDVDVDEAIEMLITTGLKNQAHTLKLSRLMVRASEPSQRTILLRILRHGEFPCRRLFLDYHGLRLIHGWMNDAQQLYKTDPKQESLRLELLQTLATLPIPNKTMLQDSKVLSTVEIWSTKTKEESPELDSESNSPKIEVDSSVTDQQEQNSNGIQKDKNLIKAEETSETEEPTTPTKSNKTEIKPVVSTSEKVESTKEIVDTSSDCDEIRKSVGMDIENIRSRTQILILDDNHKTIQDIVDLFEEDMDISSVAFSEIKTSVSEVRKEEKRDYEVEIIALALKLLEEWLVLKEVFRIPKKERIEQMKEHEREADRGYKAGLEHDIDRKSRSRYRGHKIVEERTKKMLKPEDRNTHMVPKLSKYERRKLFAMQVEQEEVERRFKQRELWRQHELHCMAMGTDPRFTPMDVTRNFQYVWNPQTGQWQTFAVNSNPVMNPNLPPPPRFNSGVYFPFSSNNMPPPALPNNPNLLHTHSNITHLKPNLRPINLQNTQTIQLPSNISVNLPNSIVQNIISVANNGMMANSPIVSTHSLVNDVLENDDDKSEVKFVGPIPPPVKLPPRWKSAKDRFGRPYYYHIKIRVSQWEPPELSTPLDLDDDSSETTSSSETSSLSSDTSSEESDDDDLDDTKLLLEIRKKFQHLDSKTIEEDTKVCSPIEPILQTDQEQTNEILPESKTSLDERLQEEFNVSKQEIQNNEAAKRKRLGLVTEVHIISPRSEEDKLFAKENLRKYKENKEKLKRQKDVSIEQSKKRVKVTVKSAKSVKKHKSTVKAKLKEAMDLNTEAARKIKEAFRSSMASVMVGILNPYRKPDCKEGRIANTEDFKHLARKLTHFVMLKELKHCQNIEDLICTESVKSKAKEFVRKYMSKFGDTYNKPKDDLEY